MRDKRIINIIGSILSFFEEGKFDQDRNKYLCDKIYRYSRDLYDSVTNFGDTRKEIQYWDFDEYNALIFCHSVFEKLAELNYKKSFFLLYQIYYGGQGAEKDSEKIEKYRKLMLDWKSGGLDFQDSEILCDFGVLLEESDGDPEEIDMFYTKSATIGNPHAQYLLGLQLFETDLDKSNSWLMKAAEQNHFPAYCYLASGLMDKLDTFANQRSAIEGFDLYAFFSWRITKELQRISADNGHDWAQFFVGQEFLELGLEDAGLRYLKKADETGRTSADSALKDFYYMKNK